MANGNGAEANNQLSPGGTVNPIIASPFTAKEAMGNLLWRYAKDLPSELYGLIKVPGQVYTGELQPSMTPGPGLASVPEYALGLAGTGLGVGGGAALAGAELAPEGAITHFPAFHGTPAAPYSRFADEFMGSGEGAQAYSWGHYVAQRTGTAESYMPSETQLTLDGKPWDYSSDIDDYHKNMALDWMKSSYGNVGDVVAGMHQEADMLEEDLNSPHQYGMSMNTSDTKQQIEDLRHSASFLLDNQDKITATTQTGNLARVNVVPDHEDFMDWDLPFSKQEPAVQEKLRNVFSQKMETGGFGSNYLPGRDPEGRIMYDDLAGYHYDNLLSSGSDFRGSASNTSRMMASKELDAAGIPGMRFADQGSRSLPSNKLIYNGDSSIHPAVRDVYQGFEDVPSMRYYLDALGNQPGGHQFKSGVDWLDKNASSFESVRNPKKSYNYVVYDPNNIEITHWNDVPVTPVEGTPPGLPDVSGTAPPGGAP